MRTTSLLILVASTLTSILATHAQLAQPEVLYNFPLEPRYPDCRLVEGRDGNFYGTAYGDSTYDQGTFFKVSTNGVLTTLLHFDWTNGAAPRGPLALGDDGNIYGTTVGGGAYGKGTVFRTTPNGALTTLFSFNGPDCCVDADGLILGRDGNFYGTTGEGGSNNLGTIFKVSTNGALTVLTSFNGTNGLFANSLVLAKDGTLYGTTVFGGYNYIDRTNVEGQGTVFKLTREAELTTLVSFDGTNGLFPNSLLMGADGNLYGTTGGGSIWDANDLYGTVFRVTTNGLFTTLVSFNGTNGASPSGLVLGKDGNIYGITRTGGSNGAGTIFKLTAGEGLTTLVSFDTQNSNPEYEQSDSTTLLLASDGNFYGTSQYGGNSGLGTVFKLTTDGVINTLVSFLETSAGGVSALVLGNDGNFYGTTSHGGSNNSGTAFRVTTNGVFSTLASFGGTYGAVPSSLLLGNDGNFYGTTTVGGSAGNGTAFKLSSNGELTTLLTFDTNAYSPHLLARGNDGAFYGGTGAEYRSSEGTVFNLTADGKLTTLAFLNSFLPPDLGNVGNTRLEALVIGGDGTLYATAPRWGGRCSYGCGFSPLGFGSVLKITTSGEVTPLAWFQGTNGSLPTGLVMGNDGNFYGTTQSGGSNYLDSTNTFDPALSGFGTVFRLTTNGELTTLVSFDGTTGGFPKALVLGSDGSLYGEGQSMFRVELGGALTSLSSFNGLGLGPRFLLTGNDGNLYGLTDPGGSGGGGTLFRLNIPGAASPKIISTTKSGNVITLTWLALPGRPYQLQVTTSLTSPSWTNSGGPITATNTTMSASDTFISDPQRFYRLALLP